MELKEMRKLLGLSQAAFGEKYNIHSHIVAEGRISSTRVDFP